MCVSASLTRPSVCNIPGGIKRLIVMESAALSSTTFTLGTLSDRFKVTAITGSPDAYEIPFDKKREAQAIATKQGNAFTHNINVRITSNEHVIFRDVDDLQNCCGYVAFVQDNYGAWFLLGCTLDRVAGAIDIGELDVTQADYDTDSTVAGEATGFTIALNSEQMNSTMIPVASAAVTTLLGLIVPFVP